METGPYNVYTLCNADVVFYVGVTNDDKRRWEEHCSLASRGSRLHVHRKLRKLWQEGKQPWLSVVVSGVSEACALKLEREFISNYGTDQLTNELTGGDIQHITIADRERVNGMISKAVQSLADKGLWHRNKHIRCRETGEEYISLTDAARAYGVSKQVLWDRVVGNTKPIGRWKRRRRRTALVDHTFEYT